MLHSYFVILFLLHSPPPAVVGQFRIVGGEEVTTLSSAPFTVSFNATDDQGGSGIFCSGVLITCGTVLTAAHCLINRSVAYIRLGSLQYGSGGRLTTSRQFTIHPQYNLTTQENDIALLYLPEKRNSPPFFSKNSPSYSYNMNKRKKWNHHPGRIIPACNSRWETSAAAVEDKNDCEIEEVGEVGHSEEGSSITASPICLPGSSQEGDAYLSSRLLTVAGWGQWDYSVQALSPALQSITVASIPIPTCHRLYSENTKVGIGGGGGGNVLLLARFTAPGADRRILCAHWPGRAICLGDSGGALFARIGSSSSSSAGQLNLNPNPNLNLNYNPNSKFILLGIASETLECGRNGVPDIYTRVDAYLHWISANQR